MKYKVVAYHAKVNTLLELKEGVIPAGVVYPTSSNELFIICLEPLEKTELPEEEEKQGGVGVEVPSDD